MAEADKIIDKEYRAEMKSRKKDEKVIYTSFLETENIILEQVRNANDANDAISTIYYDFVIFNKESKLTDRKPSIVIGEREYRPIESKLLTDGVILLPSDVEEYDSEAKLAKTIEEFLGQYFEVPPFFAKFLPYLAMFYWVYDRFPFVPYLHFIGLTGTGKTTAQEVFGSICYKPINASGAITMSPIFRTASRWHGTLLLDEFEPEGEGYKDIIAFLKSGVGNTAVLRTEGESKREVEAYIVKSPKVFTSENPISNAGLQSRTIVIEMEKNKKKIPLYRLGKFLRDAEHIRNQLLLWRLHNLDNIKLDEIEYGFPELQGFDRRVQQVLTPIYYLSDKETRKTIIEFAKIQEKETKKERLESLDGQVFQAISDSYPEEISLKKICEIINSDRAIRPINEKRVANIVRKILRFRVEMVGHENTRMVILEGKEDRIRDLRDYFGLSMEEPFASFASEADGESERTNNKNDANDQANGK